METLAERIARDGPLSAEDAVGWIIRVAKHVESLHQHGVSHGRLSLTCIRTKSAERAAPALMLDVRKAPPNDAYHCPERVSGASVSTADDQWAIVAMLYELLTSQPPFSGKQSIVAASPAPLAVFDAGDDGLQSIISRGFSAQPESRFSSVEELRTALQQWHPDPRAAQLMGLLEEDTSDEDEAATVMATVGSSLLEQSAFDDPDFDDAPNDDDTVMRELPAHIIAMAGRAVRGSTSPVPPPPDPDGPPPPRPPPPPQAVPAPPRPGAPGPYAPPRPNVPPALGSQPGAGSQPGVGGATNFPEVPPAPSSPTGQIVLPTVAPSSDSQLTPMPYSGPSAISGPPPTATDTSNIDFDDDDDDDVRTVMHRADESSSSDDDDDDDQGDEARTVMREAPQFSMPLPGMPTPPAPPGAQVPPGFPMPPMGGSGAPAPVDRWGRPNLDALKATEQISTNQKTAPNPPGNPAPWGPSSHPGGLRDSAPTFDEPPRTGAIGGIGIAADPDAPPPPRPGPDVPTMALPTPEFAQIAAELSQASDGGPGSMNQGFPAPMAGGTGPMPIQPQAGGAPNIGGPNMGGPNMGGPNMGGGGQVPMSGPQSGPYLAGGQQGPMSGPEFIPNEHPPASKKTVIVVCILALVFAAATTYIILRYRAQLTGQHATPAALIALSTPIQTSSIQTKAS